MDETNYGFHELFCFYFFFLILNFSPFEPLILIKKLDGVLPQLTSARLIAKASNLSRYFIKINGLNVNKLRI